jgi:hypothetical protein
VFTQQRDEEEEGILFVSMHTLAARHTVCCYSTKVDFNCHDNKLFSEHNVYLPLNISMHSERRGEERKVSKSELSFLLLHVPSRVALLSRFQHNSEREKTT